MSTNGKGPLSNGDRLLNLHEMPEWAQSNPNILTGYRPICQSYRACIASWTFAHNESMNIFSHLLLVLPVGSLLMRAILVLTGKAQSLSTPLLEDILVFSAFFLGALACTCFSTAYHTFMSHSEEVANLTKQFDYAGITCLIFGSFVPTIYCKS